MSDAPIAGVTTLADPADPTWQRVVETAPSLLWPLLVLFVLLLFRTRIRDKLSDLTSVKVVQFEAEFTERLAEARPAADGANASEQRGAIGRAARARAVCDGRRILWVDDHPGNNQTLGELFAQLLGVRIRYSLDTGDALRSLLTDSGFTMVITDMTRGPDDRAGTTLLRRMIEENVSRPTIFFTGQDSAEVGVPPGAFARTNRADLLLHCVIDVCERAAQWD
jgi:CheY-like chemotaxis protein